MHPTKTQKHSTAGIRWWSPTGAGGHPLALVVSYEYPSDMSFWWHFVLKLCPRRVCFTEVPAQCFSTAERTGSPEFIVLWVDCERVELVF